VNGVKRLLIRGFEWFGELGMFCARLVRAAVTPPYEWRELFRQCDGIGAKSLPLVALAGAATGVVMSLETRDSLVRFGAGSFLPAVIVISLLKESGPVITGLVVSGRVAAGIGAELGSMRVTEQIDAMETMAVNPVQYLAVPRFLASLAMFPALTMLFNALGYVGGYLMGIFVSDIPPGPFIEHTRTMVENQDVIHGLFKSIIFGGVVAVITCYRGYAAEGGARGVGEGTTRAVVMSSIAILVFDYALTLGAIGK
jgi:phospholipid/cholesterol/gamma-HCH transport system permease protein